MDGEHIVRDGRIFSWSEDKNRLNRAKHKIDFDLASYVFDDDGALYADDPYPAERRYRTIGMIGPVCLFVVWTERENPDDPDNPIIRIISARRAGSRERRCYEEGIF